MSTILQEPHEVLRSTASLVPLPDIKSDRIQTIIEEMKKALVNEDDGVAIAAPQIGHALRIFVVSKKINKKFADDLVFINPEIIRLGKEKVDMTEGCLSVRWKYGLVKRSTTASVRAYNALGNEFVMAGRGLLAQIFQHETDHLNGVLFIDKATNIEDLNLEGIGNDGTPIYGTGQRMETLDGNSPEIKEFQKYIRDNFHTSTELSLIEDRYKKLIASGINREELLNLVKENLISGFKMYAKDNSNTSIPLQIVQEMYNKLVRMGMDKKELTESIESILIMGLQKYKREWGSFSSSNSTIEEMKKRLIEMGVNSEKIKHL